MYNVLFLFLFFCFVSVGVHPSLVSEGFCFGVCFVLGGNSE